VVPCAKTAELIKMPFGFWPRMSRWNHMLDGVQRCWGTLSWQPFLASIYGVHIGATWRIRLNRLCAAAMRPYVKKLLWPLVLCCGNYNRSFYGLLGVDTMNIFVSELHSAHVTRRFFFDKTILSGCIVRDNLSRARWFASYTGWAKKRGHLDFLK